MISQSKSRKALGSLLINLILDKEDQNEKKPEFVYVKSIEILNLIAE